MACWPSAYTRINAARPGQGTEAAKQQLDRALRTSDGRLQAVARFRLGELYLQAQKG